jgi:RecA/RadA recombinase
MPSANRISFRESDKLTLEDLNLLELRGSAASVRELAAAARVSQAQARAALGRASRVLSMHRRKLAGATHRRHAAGRVSLQIRRSLDTMLQWLARVQ